MRSLVELQNGMTQAILNGDAAPLAGELVARGADPLRRFDIYRNNTFLSLIRHLKAVFPVTARLSDDRFFSYAAFDFIRSQPPREPRLFSYGRTFPHFLSRFPACRAAPILPAVASLEWAVHVALTAPEEPSLPATALASTSQVTVRLVLQPSLQIALSRWRLLPLFDGTHGEGTPLARRRTYTAVVRRGDNIRFMELSSARYIFWRSLRHGAQLDYATARALARDPMFNLVEEILTLFRANLVIAFDSSHAH